MLSIPDREPAPMEAEHEDRGTPESAGNQGQSNRSNYGRKGSRGPWAHLDKETRERYEAIEKRCVEKWGKG